MTNKFVKIYDDLLSESEQEEYEKQFTSVNFPWYFQKSTLISGETDFHFLAHNFYGKDRNPSDFMSIPVQILQKFIERTDNKYTELLRIQGNLVHKTNWKSHSQIHIDNEEPHHVLIYYVINSDGNTVMFEDENIVEEIAPKKGRFVLFDGNIFHAHFPCIQYDKRIVINYNLVIPN